MHIGYLTLHLPSGQYYIGVHSAENLADGYLGSGVGLVKATRANGSDQFHRFDIVRLDNRDDACEWEVAVITPELLPI